MDAGADITDEDMKLKDALKSIIGDFGPSSVKVSKNLFEPYEQYLLNDNSLQRTITYDIEQFTRLKKEIAGADNPNNDVWALENIRVFSRDSMKSRGIFYSLDVAELASEYTYLRDTTVTSPVNDLLYQDRYIYPLCLPNGDVFCHMGYSPGNLMKQIQIDRGERIIIGLNDMNPFNDAKYVISKCLWINQGSLLGNLESLSLYDGQVVFCVEGYFDALRINDEFKCKSVAMLNSTMTKAKLNMLYQIKRQGHYLVYVPDLDEAGMSAIVRHPIWDDIYVIPVKSIKNLPVKDIDGYIKSLYLDSYYNGDTTDLRTVVPTKVNVHDVRKLNVPFYEMSMGVRMEIMTRILKGGD